MAEAAAASVSSYAVSELRKLDEGVFTWDLRLPDSSELMCSPYEVTFTWMALIKVSVPSFSDRTAPFG